MSEHNSKSNICANGESAIQVEDSKSKSTMDECPENEETDAERTDENDKSDAPVDRGWAWVVLAGIVYCLKYFPSIVLDRWGFPIIAHMSSACVFEIFIYGGIIRSFGVFFLQYQMRFNATASETAIMNLIQNIVTSTTVLFVMTIGLQKFSSRAAVFMGGVFTVVAFLITAFTSDIRVFYFAQGVVGGTGLALIHPPMLAIIGVYFKKHRGLANSIFNGGGSIGGLTFAPVVVKLFDEYQFTGTLLIVSGLLMNICVAALLLRPIESYTKKNIKLIDKATEIKEKDQLLLNDASRVENGNSKQLTFNENKSESYVLKTTYNSHITNTPVEFSRMQSFDLDIMRSKSQGSPLLHRVRAHSVGVKRQRTISENNCKYDSENNIHHSKNVLKGVIDAISRSQVAIYSSGEGICGSFFDVNIASSKGLSKDEEVCHEVDVPQRCCLKMKSCILSVLCTVFDLRLLHNPVFLTFLLMAFSVMSGTSLLPVFIPSHAKDIGISNKTIGLLLSLMAIIDLVSKITMGVAADRKWIKRSTILAVSTFVLGTSSHLLRFVNSLPSMIVLVVIAGLCCGQYMSMNAVFVMEVIGLERFKSSLGFVTLVQGVSVAVFFPLVGLLRDTTGSYVASFHLLGGLAYMAGVLAYIIPLVNKWKKRKETEKR